MKKSRLWTEDELVLLYWFLPIMRKLAVITHREFSGIAMKLANLLAVETYNAEGLSNASALDREIVNKYSKNHKELELKVITIMSSGIDSEKRLNELRVTLEDILKTHRVPLNLEVIKDLTIARNPMLVAPLYVIRDLLIGNENISTLGNDVFKYKN